MENRIAARKEKGGGSYVVIDFLLRRRPFPGTSTSPRIPCETLLGSTTNSDNYNGGDLLIAKKSLQRAYGIQISVNIETHKWTWLENYRDSSGAEVPDSSPFHKWRGYLGFGPQLVWVGSRLPEVESSRNRRRRSTTPNDDDAYLFILLHGHRRDDRVPWLACLGAHFPTLHSTCPILFALRCIAAP